jgi:hypothetical protein
MTLETPPELETVARDPCLSGSFADEREVIREALDSLSLRDGLPPEADARHGG